MRLHELISTNTYLYHKLDAWPRTQDDLLNNIIYEFDADGISFLVFFETSGTYEGYTYFITFETKIYGDERKKKKNVFKIFGTIEKIVTEFLDEVKPDYLMWSGDKKRKSIYRRFNHPDYRRLTGRPGLVRKSGLVK